MYGDEDTYLIHSGSVQSFNDLLLSGQIVEALELRLESIESAAKQYREEVEAARVSSSVFFLAGMLLGANPIVGVLGGAAAIAYGYTLYKDYQHTARFFPLPLARKTIGQLLDALGLAASFGQGMSADPLSNVINYVEPSLAHEYEMVYVGQTEIARILGSFDLPAQMRLPAYKYILRHSRILGNLEIPSLKVVVMALGGIPVAAPQGTADVGAKNVGQLPGSSEPGPTIDLSGHFPGDKTSFVFAQDDRIARIAAAILRTLEIQKLPCTYIKGVNGYKFDRILLRNHPTTNIDAVQKLGKALFSELGVLFPDIEKPPVLSQIRGGLIAVDVPKPKSDWRVAFYKDFIVKSQKSFESPVKLLIGVNMDGALVQINLSEHNTCSLLVGGVKGGGKSNWSKAAIAAIAQQYSPESVRLVLSDVQSVEFEAFKNLPHLFVPVANSPDETVKALLEAEAEMERRKPIFTGVGATNIDEYNAQVSHERMFRLVIFIEETADIMLSKSADEFSRLKQRFNQVGRKWGVYLVDSTQSPRREVIDPLIRGQFSAFLAFMTTRPEESKIILGNQNEDAVNLLGYGDGILMTTYSSERIQALRIEGEEVLKVVEQAVALYGPPKFGASTEHPAPPDAPPTDSNNLTLERLRLEFAATLPCEEIPPPPADDEPITTASVDPDWEIFQKIKEGRKRQTDSDGKKTRKSPNKLCQEIFGLKSDGGNSMKAALKEYRRIRDKFAAVWIRELLEQGVGQNKIIEEVYNINTLKQSEYKKNNPTEWATINRVIQDVAQVLRAQPNPELENE